MSEILPTMSVGRLPHSREAHPPDAIALDEVTSDRRELVEDRLGPGAWRDVWEPSA